MLKSKHFPYSVFVPLSLALLISAPARTAPAQTPPAAVLEAKTDAQLEDEAERASVLRRQGQTLAALPLYDDLHAHRPANAIYMEGLAMAYIARAGASTAPEAIAADRNRARQLFLEAQATGDHSDLLQVMLEKLSALASLPTTPPSPATRESLSPAARESLSHAEILFSKGDLKGAIDLYRKAWEQDPKNYSAPLFAGDAEYKLAHFEEAGVWFARAIAISPDRETAHRYWADCLKKAGKPLEARRQYVEAFLADPYSKAPRLSLRAWAQENHMRFIPPPILIAARIVRAENGGTTITLDPAKATAPLAGAWLAYSMNSAAWQREEFKRRFPEEKIYRHTLAEEVGGLRAALSALKAQQPSESSYDPTFRSLLALDHDGMLECWILLDNPDNGTARDYAAFRATHRDLLRTYIDKYDLHPA